MERSTHARRAFPATWLFVALSGACILVGVTRASRSAWVTDDAFISFRYARNLVEGHGLVFNPGERVEGYTNFLWTAWSAAALGLGLDPVRWSLGWGVAAYAASIALLAAHHAWLRDTLAVTGATLPAGAILAALNEDWSLWATGGLETAAFAFLALAGFVLLAGRPEAGARRLVAGGAVFALTSLTRPDGVVFAAVAGAWLVATAARGSRLRGAALFALGFSALWVPYTLARVAYYGDFWPNTYHAKSAYLAWYGQGWQYLRLFLIKYWVLLVAPALLALAVPSIRQREGFGPWVRAVLLAGALVLAYTFSVVRVGGDFMFGRLLVPTLPFWAVLFDLGVLGLARRRALHAAATALLAVGLLAAPAPIEGREIAHGIADEPRHYSPEAVHETDRRAEILRRYFEGLSVTVGFTGSEARLVYRARIPRAIECETGLTDREIARQTLDRRGRPGHEKHARLEYLVDERGAQFVFNRYALRIIGAEGRLPPLAVELDGVQAYPLYWDAELLAELARRGARVPDFPAALDRLIAGPPPADPRGAARALEDLDRFYFDHVNDPLRRAALERRLGHAPAGP